ncbi:MAG: hypothetical protein HC887_08480 [Desulfobacteraceae bacterium]|nr:hypothetical protein [Desulfobacteraceae bacterium]
MTEKRQRLKKMLSSKGTVLESMGALKAEHEQVHQAAKLLEERFRKRPEGFTLFSFWTDLPKKPEFRRKK